MGVKTLRPLAPAIPDVYWAFTRFVRPPWRRFALIPHDGGGIFRRDAMQVQVNLRRPFDRGPRRWERLSGRRHRLKGAGT